MLTTTLQLVDKQKLSPCPICDSTKKKCVMMPAKLLDNGEYSKNRLILCFFRHNGEGTPDGYKFVGISEGQMPSGKFLYLGGRSLESLRLNFSGMSGVMTQGFLDSDGNPRTINGTGVSMRGKDAKFFKGVYTISQQRLYTLEEYQRFTWQKNLFQQLAEEEARRQAAERNKNLLSIEQRDRDYQAIISQLSFKHDEVLTERGLSVTGVELAKQFGFRSWKAGVKLDHPVSPLLAGANHTGTTLRGISGMVIPCRTPYGEITGFQVRPDSDSYRAKCKYSWISSASDANGSIAGNGPSLPNGELPHYCWIYPGFSPSDVREVWLVEGGLKSFLAAQFLWETGAIDIAVIGAPGNFFGGETVQKYLSVFKSDRPDFYVRLMTDAGMTENEHVARSYFKAIRLIKSWGYNLTIGWWGQLKKKSSLDLDELIIPTGNTIKVSRVQPKTIVLINGQSLEVAEVKDSRFDSAINEKVITFTDGSIKRMTGRVSVESQLDKIEWISDDDYFELHPPKIKKLIEPFQAVKPGIMESEFPLPDIHADYIAEVKPHHSYHPDDRLELWREFVTGGDNGEGRRRYVLDSSAVGSGKSHTAGLLSADALGSDHVTKVIYLTTDPQNPSAVTFSRDNGWKILRGRDYGRVVKTTKGPDGSESRQVRRVSKEYRPEKDGPLHLPSNCDRAGLAELLANHNVPPDSAHVCNGCVYKKKCNLGVGAGYGYLAQRKEVMSAEKIIAHPEAIDLDEIGEDEVVALICEEASTFPWFKKLDVSVEDIDRTINDITKQARYNSELWVLVDVIEELRNATNKDGGRNAYLSRRYGWDHSSVVEHVHQFLSRQGVRLPQLTQEQLEGLSHQDLGILEDADQWEGADADSYKALRHVRSAETSGDHLVKEMESRLSMRWLPDFYRALNGDTDVRITCESNGFSIQIINQRLRSILTHPNVAVTIMLDGTEQPEFFEKQLKQKVHHVAADLPELNEMGHIDIIQVHGLGLMCSQRSEKQQKDLDQLVEFIRKQNGDSNLPVIDLKNYASEGDGVWHRDSRGSNVYATADALILVGMGIPSINAMRDEYALLNGYHPGSEETLVAYPIHDLNQPAGGPWRVRVMNESADRGLAAYIRKKVLTNYKQAIGRLRAIRRPGAKLTVYAVTDYPLDQQVVVTDIKQALASRQTINDRIQKSIEERIKRGWKITSRMVAKHAQCSQGYVIKSDAWKSYMAMLSASSGVIPGVYNNNNKRNHSGEDSNVDGAGVPEESQKGMVNRQKSRSRSSPPSRSSSPPRPSNSGRKSSRRVYISSDNLLPDPNPTEKTE